MLWQMCLQFKDGHTEMRVQKDINTIEEMHEFVEETKGLFPEVPEKATGWMCCNENSKHFVWAKA